MRITGGGGGASAPTHTQIWDLIKSRQRGQVSIGTSTSVTLSSAALAGVTVDDGSSNILVDADGWVYFSSVTSAVTGDDAVHGSSSSFRNAGEGGSYRFGILFAFDDITSARVFMGVTDNSTPASCLGSDDPGIGYAGLHYSTDRGDTLDTAQLILRTALAGSQAKTDDVVAFTADTRYFLEITVLGASSAMVSVQLQLYTHAADGSLTSVYDTGTTAHIMTGSRLHWDVGIECRSAVLRELRFYGTTFEHGPLL